MFSIFIVLMVYAGVHIHQKCILASFIYISYISIKLKKKSKTKNHLQKSKLKGIMIEFQHSWWDREVC